MNIGCRDMKCVSCEKGREWENRLNACAKHLAEKMNTSIESAKIILLDRMI